MSVKEIIETGAESYTLLVGLLDAMHEMSSGHYMIDRDDPALIDALDHVLRVHEIVIDHKTKVISKSSTL